MHVCLIGLKGQLSEGTTGTNNCLAPGQLQKEKKKQAVITLMRWDTHFPSITLNY